MDVDWATHVAAWRQSGGSMVGYCRLHGLKASAMGYWKKRLADKGAGRGPKAVVETPLALPLARVRRRGVSSEGSVEGGAALRVVVQGVTVEVPARFDDATLVRLLDLLTKWGTA